MTPRLYISYGMTKTGSTLAYHIARTVLEEAGFAQPQLSERALGAVRRINYVDDLTEGLVAAILNEAPGPIVIKTHQRPTPTVADMLAEGTAMGHACLRDPRDMALSMLDHGARARAKGHLPFAEFAQIDDTLPSLRDQAETLRQWRALPGILTLSYDQIAFGEDAAPILIAAQMGLPVAPGAARRAKDGHFTQFNKGIPDRHRSEMAAADAERIATLFPELVALAAQPNVARQ
ncbi:hypothetical protein FHS89_001856 [Rubricella aquisinus]|uniref:Sulfotransferase domain-containing protein n=1 Tax=Rubricella aquisinus TaxID=2028108 RepID=A0A840X1U9_9RHOB|nr:sulfotransferase domain-containing protein [Rubricella aquisinus]MBB5515836.1 hypothetical protein [Rubricella aquisinus]